VAPERGSLQTVAKLLPLDSPLLPAVTLLMVKMLYSCKKEARQKVKSKYGIYVVIMELSQRMVGASAKSGGDPCDPGGRRSCFDSNPVWKVTDADRGLSSILIVKCPPTTVSKLLFCAFIKNPVDI
jgi:hypothetical protein